MLGRLRRLLPPAALFAGLFLFGMSLFILGSEASEEGVEPLDPSSLTVANASAVLVYPADYFPYERSFLNVTFAFPQAPGDAYFVSCDDAARLMAGQEPLAPALAFQRLQEGAFRVSRQTVPDRDVVYSLDENGELDYCGGAIVLRWAAPEGDPVANRPAVSVVYHDGQLEGEDLLLLFMLMVGGALLALFGGLAWAKSQGPRAVASPSEDSTVEALRASLDRMGEQLERTRRHLLFAGVLGIFLWYPILVPWSWQQAARASDDPVVPWAVAAMTIAFLLALTLLWAREFLALDRELNAWRGRLRELRHREQAFMDTLEHEGG